MPDVPDDVNWKKLQENGGDNDGLKVQVTFPETE